MSPLANSVKEVFEMCDKGGTRKHFSMRIFFCSLSRASRELENAFYRGDALELLSHTEELLRSVIKTYWYEYTHKVGCRPTEATHEAVASRI